MPIRVKADHTPQPLYPLRSSFCKFAFFIYFKNRGIHSPNSLLPESPRYLAMKGRDQEALLVLARLHAHGDINDTFVVSEHAEILQQVAVEREETRDAWTQLFTIKSNFRRLFLGVALQFR